MQTKKPNFFDPVKYEYEFMRKSLEKYETIYFFNPRRFYRVPFCICLTANIYFLPDLCFLFFSPPLDNKK